MIKKVLACLCGAYLILNAVTPALAAKQNLLNVLLQNGTISCKQYRKLSKSYYHAGQAKQCAPAGKQAPRKKTSAKAAKPESHPANSKTPPGLKLATANKNFTFNLNGQLQVYAAFYDQDKTPLGNGEEFRRARLKFSGKIFKNWAYTFEPGFGGNSTQLYDANLQYNGFKRYSNLSITIGQSKQPFSLEQRTTDQYTTFMERALPSAFVPIYHIGLKLNAHGSNWSAATGVFGQSVSGNGDEGEHDSGAAGLARVTFAPIHDSRHLLHVGASFEYRNPGGGENVRFRSRPESHVTSVRLVDTNNIMNVDNFQVYGAEAAAALGSLEAQGEYIHNQVERSAAPTLGFNGWYAQANWFFTGESRANFYDTSNGSFSRVVPKYSYGAFELAARYSTLDLDDRDVRGGSENDISVAFNWYPNAWLKFSANYINVVSRRAGIADDPNVFQLEGQVSF